MGVGHSGDGPKGTYDDRTCVMGVISLSKDAPQECFNGWQHGHLDGLHAVTFSVQQPWHGTLVAFVDVGFTFLLIVQYCR